MINIACNSRFNLWQERKKERKKERKDFPLVVVSPYVLDVYISSSRVGGTPYNQYSIYVYIHERNRVFTLCRYMSCCSLMPCVILLLLPSSLLVVVLVIVVVLLLAFVLIVYTEVRSSSWLLTNDNSILLVLSWWLFTSNPKSFMFI